MSCPTMIAYKKTCTSISCVSFTLRHTYSLVHTTTYVSSTWYPYINGVDLKPTQDHDDIRIFQDFKHVFVELPKHSGETICDDDDEEIQVAKGESGQDVQHDDGWSEDWGVRYHHHHLGKPFDVEPAEHSGPGVLARDTCAPLEHRVSGHGLLKKMKDLLTTNLLNPHCEDEEDAGENTTVKNSIGRVADVRGDDLCMSPAHAKRCKRVQAATELAKNSTFAVTFSVSLYIYMSLVSSQTRDYSMTHKHTPSGVSGNHTQNNQHTKTHHQHTTPKEQAATELAKNSTFASLARRGQAITKRCKSVQAATELAKNSTFAVTFRVSLDIYISLVSSQTRPGNHQAVRGQAITKRCKSVQAATELAKNSTFAVTFRVSLDIYISLVSSQTRPGNHQAVRGQAITKRCKSVQAATELAKNLVYCNNRKCRKAMCSMGYYGNPSRIRNESLDAECDVEICYLPWVATKGSEHSDGACGDDIDQGHENPEAAPSVAGRGVEHTGHREQPEQLGEQQSRTQAAVERVDRACTVRSHLGVPGASHRLRTRNYSVRHLKRNISDINIKIGYCVKYNQSTP
ncbi:hypothetical protein J6590_042588, partial [Homalodisca vitripennis]